MMTFMLYMMPGRHPGGSWSSNDDDALLAIRGQLPFPSQGYGSLNNTKNT